MQTSKAIIIETSVAATLSLAVAALLSPADLGIKTLFPHPVWLAVLVMAARYGGGGLAFGLPLAWGALTLMALAMRISPADVVSRVSSGADLGALIAAVLVAAVASIHERRNDIMTKTVETLKARCAADHAAVKELRDAAVVLRARADRLETSLTFLREVASRLEGHDPHAAAQAALELAVARVGARAGTAQILEKGVLRPIASVGTWSPDATIDPMGDQTVAAALRNARPSRAFDLTEVSAADSDLAAPIMNSRRELFGVLALRGVPHGGASAVGLHDLALIASWSAKAFAGPYAQLDFESPDAVSPLLRTDAAARVATVLEADLGDSLAETPTRSNSQLNV